MPKRAEIIKRITKAAEAKEMTFGFDRRGGNHDIYKLDGLSIPVGRHRDFDEDYAVMLYKECEPKLGKGWWK